jgi:hypothetical protein
MSSLAVTGRALLGAALVVVTVCLSPAWSAAAHTEPVGAAAAPSAGPSTAVAVPATSAPLEERDASATVTTEIPGWLLPAVAVGVVALGGVTLVAARRRP